MRTCDCTIPKEFGGEEECQNEAKFKVTLTKDFESDVCYWCETCVKSGLDMIKKLVRIGG